MPINNETITNARQSGHKDDDILNSIARANSDFLTKIQKAQQMGRNSTEILDSIGRVFPETKPTTIPSTQPPINQLTEPVRIPEIDRAGDTAALGKPSPLPPTYAGPQFKLPAGQVPPPAVVGGKLPTAPGVIQEPEKRLPTRPSNYKEWFDAVAPWMIEGWRKRETIEYKGPEGDKRIVTKPVPLTPKQKRIKTRLEDVESRLGGPTPGELFNLGAKSVAIAGILYNLGEGLIGLGKSLPYTTNLITKISNKLAGKVINIPKEQQMTLAQWARKDPKIKDFLIQQRIVPESTITEAPPPPTGTPGALPPAPPSTKLRTMGVLRQARAQNLAVQKTLAQPIPTRQPPATPTLREAGIPITPSQVPPIPAPGVKAPPPPAAPVPTKGKVPVAPKKAVTGETVKPIPTKPLPVFSKRIIPLNNAVRNAAAQSVPEMSAINERVGRYWRGMSEKEYQTLLKVGGLSKSANLVSRPDKALDFAIDRKGYVVQVDMPGLILKGEKAGQDIPLANLTIHKTAKNRLIPVSVEAPPTTMAGPAPLAPTKPIPAPTGFVLKGKPRVGETRKGQLVKQAHIIAKDKGWISEKGKVKPQYRRLAEAMTGKRSIAAMNPKQAQTFVDALKKVPGPEFVAGKTKIASIPLSRNITPKGFFDRNFKEPALIEAITPSNRYAYTLGVHELIEPSIKANTARLIEQKQLHEWLEGMGKKINKLGGTSTLEKTRARVKNIPTKVEARWFDLLDKHNSVTTTGLKGDEAKIFTELRNLTDVMLKRVNEIRENVELPPIKRLSGYITHLADALSKKRLAEKYPFPEEIKFWLNRVNPKHIYNPTALRRLIEERAGLQRNPIKALKVMVSMDLKQIYLEQPNLMFRKQINALAPQLPASTRQWVQAYINEIIKGYPTKLDNMTNATLNKLGITRMIDIALKPFGRGLGINPAKEITGSLNRLIHDAVIWGKIRLVIRNHTQKLLSLGLYDTKAFVKSLLPAGKELKAIIKESDFFKISKQQFLERLPEGMLGKLEKLGFKPYGHSHASNVKQTMKAAYYAGKELVDNPKYKHLGWTEADVKKEMDFGANTAQYWYNLMGMPSLYRSGGTRFFSTLQSWWMNYTTNYWREMLSRAYYGKTGWGKEIPVKWRLGALRHIITSLLFIEGARRGLGLDYRRTALLGVLPAYLSPPAQMITGLYNYVVADSEWKKKKAARQMLYSWKAFMPGSGAWRDYMSVWRGEKPVKALFFYTEKPEPKTRTRGKRRQRR